MQSDTNRDRWARLRFAVVGPLLAAPPADGKLRAEIERLAQQGWRHPVTGALARFSFVTRWYYQARRRIRSALSAGGYGLMPGDRARCLHR